MFSSNFKRHQETCFVKTHFKMPYEEILDLIRGSQPSPSVSSIEETEKLKKSLTDFEFKSRRLSEFAALVHQEATSVLEEVRSLSLGSPLERIAEMVVAETTRKEYMSDWKAYQMFCVSSDLNSFAISSANKYISKLNCRLSTILKKRSSLQAILSFLLSTVVRLRPIRKKPQYKQKYPLSEAEIKSYLQEQKKVNKQDYLIQKLLLEFGCRINTAGSLRVHHLQFLDGVNNLIILPDSKTGSRTETISTELKEELRKHLRENSIKKSNDFVFSGRGESERQRTSGICMRINRRIKDSKVLVKSKNFVFSSHMFRKTRAFNVFSEALKKAKEEARRAIGHEPGSSSISHYI